MKFNFFRKKDSTPSRIRVSVRVPFKLHDEYYTEQHAVLESMLGNMSSAVSHSVIPFEAGGYLDLYYFENCVNGTCLASMELNVGANRALPNELGLYDLVACTPFEIDSDEEASSEFNLSEDRIRLLLTEIGKHASEHIFDHHNVIHLTVEEEDAYVIMHHFRSSILDGLAYNLMLCLEINLEEFEFASENGGDALISKLKEHNIFPYSIRHRRKVI